MGLGGLIRSLLVRVFALFYFSKRSKVIFYHDIHSERRYTDMSTYIGLFEKHIHIINKSGYEIVHEITKKHGQIAICFDDAFLGLYENIEFLKKKNIFIHLFVVSSYLGKKNYINEKQLLELNKLEYIKVSSHTHSHKILNEIDEYDVERELKESKEILEDLIGEPVDSICYPEGKFNKKTIHLANTLGYKNQYSSLPGFFDDNFEGTIIRRSLVQFSKEKEFQAILKGGDHILGIWYRLKHFKR